MGTVDYLCNAFAPRYADEWDAAIARQGVPVKVRRDPDDAFCEPDVMLAMAQSITMLFLARIVDGLSGGNISTARAYVADVTGPKDRARAYGLIGAAFGVVAIVQRSALFAAVRCGLRRPLKP